MVSTVDIVVICLLVVLMVVVFGYMGHTRKKGRGCVGCPDAPMCAKRYTGDGCKDNYK